MSPGGASVAGAQAQFLRREKRRAYVWLLGLALFVAAVQGAAAVAEFRLETLWSGLPKAAGFFERAAPDLQFENLWADEKTRGSLAYWFFDWEKWVGLILQTLEMAILATVLGGAGALALGFVAATPTTPHPAALFLCRRALELFRTIPDIVLALILVFAFGIGPPAGVLAIAIHTTGALGKLFAEVIENVDRRPLEGVRASGGGLLDEIRYGAFPQVAPNFASYGLLRFEINVASAAAIGFVGAGGIGEEFVAAINFGALQDAFAIMLMAVAVIFVIDLASEAIRHRLIGLKT